jgi:hypothetical protein
MSKTTDDGYVLYHGTSSIAAEGILREGLFPKKGTGCDAWAIKVGCRVFVWPPLVFLTAYPEKAARYAQCAASVAGGCPVILEVRVPDNHIARLNSDNIHAWMFEGTIPPEWVRVLPDQPKAVLYGNSNA